MKRRLSLTLSFYLGVQFLRTVLLTTAVLATFIYLIDVLELMGRLSNVQDSVISALYLAVLKLPDMLVQLAPFAILLGTLISFTRLSRTQELSAIRASGLSARQFLLPALFITVGAGIFNLFVFQPISAVLLKQYETQEQLLIPGSAKGLITRGGSIWLRQPLADDGEQFIYAKQVTEGGSKLEQATVFTFAPDGTFVQRLDAESMTLLPGLWQIEKIFVMEGGADINWKDQMLMPTTLSVDIIRTSLTSPHTLPVWELPNFIRVLQQTGFATQEHMLTWHRLLAAPGLMMALFLLAAPFALRFSRNYGLGRMVLVGLGMGLGFYLFGNLIATYGLAGRLPLPVAAWAPTVVAFLTSLALFLHFREE